jgi:hypothetical protein
MNQHSYEIIVACIQYGSPALAGQLTTALNSVIEKANLYNEIKRQEEQNAAKVAVAQTEEAAKVAKQK